MGAKIVSFKTGNFGFFCSFEEKFVCFFNFNGTLMIKLQIIVSEN